MKHALGAVIVALDGNLLGLFSERDLMSRLPAQVGIARSASAHFARVLADVDPARVATREELARLPVTRKSALMELQRAAMPFGGLNATPVSGLARIFVSPGPIYDPEGRRPDFWRAARGLFAAGFLPGDVVLNCYSYHLTPAGSMFETGVHRLGCAVFPGGVGQTEMQARVIADLRPVGYVGTPSFLKLILEKCDELGADSSSIKRALVSGEAFLPPVGWVSTPSSPSRSCCKPRCPGRWPSASSSGLACSSCWSRRRRSATARSQCTSGVRPDSKMGHVA